MKKIVLILSVFVGCCSLVAQQHYHAQMNKLSYPDIEGYLTLKTDLHMHSVFSDGNVWPTIRVMEALREGLDAISLTEHLEYQPHLKDIPHPDRNRAYALALEEAKDHDLLIVPGTEITRKEPIGHSNAVFITDANSMLLKEAKAAFATAKKQNAFVFWNHPAWYAQSPTGNPILSNFQEALIKENELHGIEVINSQDYAEESLAIALEHNLAIMGTSDVHGLIDWDYTEKGNHRPITLVFAKERNLASLKEALFARRTVAVFNSLFVGRPEFLNPLLTSCIQVESAEYIKNTTILKVALRNTSSSDLLFENAMPFTFYSKAPIFEIKAGETITLEIKTLQSLDRLELRLTALGAYTAPKTHPTLSWLIPID
ncbi:Sb-PDE family phosphodiesterase [Arenibacter sp. GZD96]|uniref:Sb-PDE family phosphodiesterase n=1 Tax=Aurantibrevibacter litoralis TaxID=3106030 RepID=UPI002AFE3C1E|nr:Sb-PDE family phosphodiesterase [Arenibacter sp. GZD-96]MEA1785151.1 Sb-PDE family phosphodiesterase [Arenibacter sp. GZD-96]